MSGGIIKVLFILLCAGGVFLLFYPIFKIGVIGAGDIKLFMVCATILEIENNIFFLGYTFLIAAILSFLKMIHQRNLFQRFRYFFNYSGQAIKTVHFTLYEQEHQEKEQIRRRTIHLAGPACLSLLLHLGGIY